MKKRLYCSMKHQGRDKRRDHFNSQPTDKSDNYHTGQRHRDCALDLFFCIFITQRLSSSSYISSPLFFVRTGLLNVDYRQAVAWLPHTAKELHGP